MSGKLLTHVGPLKQLIESVSNDDRSVEKSFNTVRKTNFGFSSQFCWRFVNTFFPTYLTDFLYLQTKFDRQ